jgi:hypothetical protein
MGIRGAVHLSHSACADGGVDPVMRQVAADQIKTSQELALSTQAAIQMKAPAIVHEGSGITPEQWICLLSRAAFTVHAVNPRDAEDAGFDGYFNFVANMEAIEIVGIHRQAFHFLVGTPRLHDQAASAADQPLHQEFRFHALRNVNRLGLGIHFAIQKNRRGQNPGQWNKAGENPFEDFDFLMLAGAAVKHCGDRQSDEKQHSKENQHEVQIERRVDLRNVGKEQGTDEEKCELQDEALTK